MNFGQARALYQILSAEFPRTRAKKLPYIRDPLKGCQCLQYLIQWANENDDNFSICDEFTKKAPLKFVPHWPH